MKIWVFVEGESDRIALEALWATWRTSLSKKGWGIQVIPLDDKSRYFRKIGPRAAEKLAGNNDDLVVGLPDLYPNSEYSKTEYKHADLAELKAVQADLVKDAIQKIYSMSQKETNDAMSRFFPTALKHDLEMLLLASVDGLRRFLGTKDTLGKWRHPVEDQNQTKPPKRVIEYLFRTKKHQCYLDTVHARAVLKQVEDIKEDLLYGKSGQLECPVFKEMLDWISSKTGVKAY